MDCGWVRNAELILSQTGKTWCKQAEPLALEAKCDAFCLQRSLSTEELFLSTSLKILAGGGEDLTPSGWLLCPSNCR